MQRVPVIREVLADLDTPLSTFLKLANKPYTYLFESIQGGEKWGRYSIIGLPCRTVIKVTGYEVCVTKDKKIIEQTTVKDPLLWIEQYQARFQGCEIGSDAISDKQGPNLPRFTGGLVGYFAYDTVRYIEPRLGDCPNPDLLNTPDILFMVSDEVVVFDNLSGKLHIIVHIDPQDETAKPQAEQRLDELVHQLSHSLPDQQRVSPGITVKESDFTFDFSREEYEKAVQRAKEYIVEGDVMQVVLSQRMTVAYNASPLDLYRALRSLNPSPYMFYLDLEEFHVVGSSPEILVHLEDGKVTVRPIAGTRPRGKTEQEDIAFEQELLADPKELAEHLMLIDLGRNDVGRIAKTGSVQLTEKMIVERYSHVMHIVSNVTGDLQEGKTAMDVLRATFPAGTLSGAPKIRAMEIIDELEPVKRSIYSGAVGYLSWSGNMDTAIAIRTAVIKDKMLHIQTGAGIVADSVPAKEWEECMNKGRAVFRAVAMAEAGLNSAHK
ncbi:MAG: anthranilate synthase component I [Gammaproteobacteria bacterium]|nr:anthranilate synthase component I [Gammaproteobacteria bacterium]